MFDPDAALMALVRQIKATFDSIDAFNEVNEDKEGEELNNHANFVHEQALNHTAEALQYRLLATPARTVAGLARKLEVFAAFHSMHVSPTDDTERALQAAIEAIATECAQLAARCGGACRE